MEISKALFVEGKCTMEMGTSSTQEIGMKIVILVPERIFLRREKDVQDHDRHAGYVSTLRAIMESTEMYFVVNKPNTWLLQ